MVSIVVYIIILSMLFLGIIAYEVPRLIKRMMWRELIAFSVLLFIGMFLSFSGVLGVSIPTLQQGIEAVFSPVSELINGVL